ncbi:hypothetical protein Tcan_16427 [Toxocara canis]|uniref:Uncharacterized protein n=1 Tax=Toxocara canis TaxID=6265 RepID=A0A0B2UWA7_TOXCA|nr:hypothetical protein Tcan_16427 [Toxocara canis]
MRRVASPIIDRIEFEAWPILRAFRIEDSTSAGGFSFLVSDGLHQIGPEWFTVESSERVSVAVEANARLVIPPGNTPSTIGMDLLRAHIPNVWNFSFVVLIRDFFAFLSAL